MAKTRKRYFEVSPGWAGAQVVGLLTEGYALAPLTTTLCFKAIEALFGKPVPSSGQFQYDKRPNAIPDMVQATGKAAIVTAAFKSVVESMAPGEAEFRPFAMRWPDDEPVAGEWYLMNVLNLVDCFDYERMGQPRPKTITRDPATGEGYAADDIWLLTLASQDYFPPPNYIDPRAVEPLKIWRPLFKSHSLFCSDVLVKALKKAGVKRLHVERLGTPGDPVEVYEWAAMGILEPGARGPRSATNRHATPQSFWRINDALSALIEAGAIATALRVRVSRDGISLSSDAVEADLTRLSAHSAAQPQYRASIHGLLDGALAESADPAAQLDVLIARLQTIVPR